MPVDPNAAIEISAYKWVPEFAHGLVRDLRVRWALEEAGLAYRVRLLDAFSERPKEYLREQPFGQVPILNDGDIHLFETGAIVLHIAERSEALMPRDPAGRARTTAWVIASLNSIEPMIMELAGLDFFHRDAEWAKARRPGAEQNVRTRLGRLSAWLGERDHLEERFTAGDLMMTTMLRILRHTDIVAGFPNLARYQARCEARPAFQRALDAQIAAFKAHQPAAAA
ncbi:MAG: glutathione S-transferase family protein [Alphaproteobacteria bacterium]|nr:glutathione S-transferase family protein [Alphaproteobacteria bacterium]MCW5740436.1 glutathione S-transferase family protein [Alphaproteobacteria bacterium]